MKKALIIGTAIYLFMAALLLGAISLISVTQIAVLQPEQGSNTLMGAAILGAMMVANIGIGVGLLKRTGWSRIAILVTAGFTLFTGLITAVLFAVMLPIMVPAGTFDPMVQMVILIPVVLFMVIIPIVQLVAFTRKSVVEMFHHRPLQEGERARPIGITVLAVLTGIGAAQLLLSMLMAPQMHPVSLFGIHLSGMGLTLYLLTSAGLSVFMAYGFWHLLKQAWYTAIVVYSFGIITTLYQAAFKTAPGTTDLPQVQGFAMNSNFLLSIYLFSAACSLGFLIYIVSRKKYFFEKSVEEIQ